MTQHFAKRLNGKILADEIRKELTHQILSRKKQHLRSPCLAVILVGTDPASEIYVQNKQKACQQVGIESKFFPLPEKTSENKLIHLIQTLNENADIDGILLQLPLPQQINADKILEIISPAKDVDGFHPYNLGRLAQRHPTFRPCTPYGVMKLLEHTKEIFKNRHAVIIGASNIVGRPMALELLSAGATITVCHRFTKNLKKYITEADILISAVGKPHLIRGDWIKINSTVIDVGISRLPNGQLVGDIEFAVAEKYAAWITPVPGGVGPMTVAMLLKNTLQAAEQSLYFSHS